MKVFLNILLWVVIFIGIFLVIVSLFFLLWKPFGKNPSRESYEKYKAAANFNSETKMFVNENKYSVMGNSGEKNNFVSKNSNVPSKIIDSVKPNLIENLAIDDFNVTWIGHSTILMQMHGMNILIDPMFSDYASPVQFAGPKRFSKLPIKISELPQIDVVVISHDHYDHLDYNSIIELKDKTKEFVVPLGVECHLERWGIEKEKITSMMWWEEITINNLRIGCTPGRHNSVRIPTKSFATLWASWVFIDEYNKVFYTGDTGYDKHFKDIYDKYGEFDLALMECGQYDVAWKSTHMTPEESVEAGKDLHASVLMPIHWGTFSISNHGWDDSIIRFVKKAKEDNIVYTVPKIGETFDYKKELKIDEWWTNVE